MSNFFVEVPEVTKDIQAVFPDGFKMTYRALWMLGEPSEELHYKETDRLIQEHGGSPKFYATKNALGLV